MGVGDVQVGQWGGPGGGAWAFRPECISKIIKIVIHFERGFCVNGLTFTYTDHCGHRKDSPTFGRAAGETATINFSNDENITGMSGTVGNKQQHVVITSLAFSTNKKNYGPYGGEIGTGFSLPVTCGKFVGFYGKAGWHIDSIGAYLNQAVL